MVPVAAITSLRAAEASALLVPTKSRTSYPNLGCPVRGAEDRVIEPKQARDLHQALPRSDLNLVPNAGHLCRHCGVATAVSLIGDRAA